MKQSEITYELVNIITTSRFC